MTFQWKRSTQRAAYIFTALFSLTSAALAGTVSISAPTSGSTVSSNFHLVASASSSSAIKAMNVYLDGSKKFGVSSSKIDTYISASSGSHRVVVQALDSSGYFSKAIYVTVGSASTGGTTTSTGGSTISNIDQMTGWDHCTVCAGTDGNGSTASYSMTKVGSPSMDGHSIKFFLGGTNNYSNALWWKQLGGKSSAHHFVYDIYFYLNNPGAAQALEFDANQSVGGHKYIFGTECSMKSSKTWRIWSASRSWFSTGVPCGVPAAYKWHHLTWEFQRTTDNKVKFVSVTLDGRKSYINTVVGSKSSSVNELNVAFQMDGDKYQTDYSVWTDKISLRYW